MPGYLFSLFVLFFISTVFIYCQQPPSNNVLPYFETPRGNHYQVGYSIGQHFQSKINSLIFNKTLPIQDLFIPFATKNNFLIQNYLQINQFNFPDYVDELKGMADGARVPFELIFLLNIETELYNLLDNAILYNNNKEINIDNTLKEKYLKLLKRNGVKGKSCSDVFLSHQDKQLAILGHNEDNDPYMRDYAYIVKYNLIDSHGMDHTFTAYHYGGTLAGNAWGWNRHLAITTNAQSPVSTKQVGVARCFLNRYIYDSNTIHDAVERLVRFNGQTASGFATNIASLYKTNYHTSSEWFEMADIELAPAKNTSYFVYNVKVWNATNQVESYYGHFNQYRNLKVLQNIGQSTAHRLARSLQFTYLDSEQGVKNLLGDQQDRAYPIFRDGTPPDGGLTTATVLFHLTENKAKVFIDNPKTGKPIYEFKLY